ncbi:MAG: hypothetical protein FD180_4542 [Planctomycetota bacterium]|nr:MAG: hypothetical protein FD180_4542 [Planctomycetota bacterium]
MSVRFGSSRLSWYGIVLLCSAAAVVYGIIHDQITARVCVEYFTIAHPPLVNSDSPTVLGFAFGAAATWWVGALLGVVLATCCEAGPWPRIPPRDLMKPILILLGAMAVLATSAGFIGYHVGIGREQTDWWIYEGIPEIRMARFSADAWAHLASYAFGALGGVVLSTWALLRRHKLAHPASATAATP